MIQKILLIAGFLLAAGEALAKPTAPKVVLQFTASTNNRHSPTVTLPYVNNPIGWTNEAFWAFDQDNCFTLKLSTAQPTATVSLNFRFGDYDHVTRNLFRHNGAQVSKQFCLDQYIYLNRMQQYLFEVDVEGLFPDPIEVTLEQHSGNWTFVQYPGQATVSDGWLFYNDLFDYSFDGPTHDTALYSLCDQIANCYQYEKKPFNDNRARYSLRESDRKQLSGTTPFVRIHSDQALENVDSVEARKAVNQKYQLNYNLAPQNSLSQIQRLYPGSTLNVTANSFSFTRQFIRQGQNNRIPITIPLNSIDHRFQQVTVQLQILGKYNNSYLELVGVNKTPSTANGLTWPNARIQSDGEFTVSTRDFLTLGPADEARESFASQSLSADFELYFDYDFKQLDVEVTITVAEAELAYRGTAGMIGDYPKHLWVSNNPLWDHREHLEWIGWRYVYNLANASDWVYKDRIQLNLTDVSIENGKKINPDNLKVKRLILGSRGEYFSLVQIPLNFNSNWTESWYNEPIIDGELPQTEEYFRVGYYIEIGDDFELNRSMGVEVHIHMHDNIFPDENCKHEPTFGSLVCHNELYHCPHYFAYNVDKQFCQYVGK